MCRTPSGSSSSRPRPLIELMGAEHVPRFYVFNKLDRLPAPPELSELSALCEGHPWVMLSAHDATAVAELEQRLIAQVRSREEEQTLFVPYRLTSQLSLIYANCRVLGTEAGDAGLKLHVQASPAVMARLRGSLKGVH